MHRDDVQVQSLPTPELLAWTQTTLIACARALAESQRLLGRHFTLQEASMAAVRESRAALERTNPTELIDGRIAGVG
jgi:hypothetical protein